MLNFIFLIVVWDVNRRLGKLANHKAEASDVQAFPRSPEHPAWVNYVANPKENVVYFKNYTILNVCIRSQHLLAPCYLSLMSCGAYSMHSLVKSKGKSPFVIFDLVFVLVSFYKVRFGTTLLMSRIASKRRCVAVAFDKM